MNRLANQDNGAPYPSAPTAAQQAKIDLWRQQHAALDAPAYRLSFVPRDPNRKPFIYGKRRDTDGEQLYTGDQIEQLTSTASAQNAKGYEVYVTPIDDSYHYIVVDDMTEASYAELLNIGYAPCLVLASSPTNYQAILKAPRQDTSSAEQSAANKVVSSVNRQVGDDRLSGVIHPFRIAGYSNRKPGKDQAFVRLIDAPGGECQRAAERLEIARERFAAYQAEQSRKRPSRTSQTGTTEVGTGDPVGEYQRRTRNQPGDVDWSGIDYGVALGMIDAGWPREAVERAIIGGSPDLARRHPNTTDYARRTVDAVIARSAGR
mgnify:CR=1 FL=1